MASLRVVYDLTMTDLLTGEVMIDKERRFKNFFYPGDPAEAIRTLSNVRASEHADLKNGLTIRHIELMLSYKLSYTAKIDVIEILDQCSNSG